VFYYKGEWFRERSPFAESLGSARKDKKGKRLEGGGDEEKF